MRYDRDTTLVPSLAADLRLAARVPYHDLPAGRLLLYDEGVSEFWFEFDPRRVEHVRGVNVGPRGDDYHVALSGQSFCTDPAAEVRDVSARPLWVPLIGQPIEYVYRGKGKQVLEVRGGTAAVYCCSYGQRAWGMDVLHVGAQVPG
jgi:hypothetical protein